MRARCVRIDHDDVRRRAVALEIAGVRGAALDAEDGLLHLALHLSLGSEFGRVIWFADVDAVVRRCPIDWNRLAAEAERWGVRGIVGYTLRVVREAFGTPVPARVLARLLLGRVRLSCVSACLATRHPPSLERGFTGYRAYVAEALLMDRARDVLAVVWRSVFLTRTWMRFHYGTAAPLRIAWYRVVHPLRVCWLALRHLA